MSAGDLVWHYTTAAGLRGILVDHKLRATSVSFVNDPSEQTRARDAVQSVFAELLESDDGGLRDKAVRVQTSIAGGDFQKTADRIGFENRYVACATTAEDSLDLWRGYGAHSVEGTYAVGFERVQPLGLLLPRDAYATHLTAWEYRETEPRPVMSAWTPVNYPDQVTLHDRARKALEEALVDYEEDLVERPLGAWDLLDRVTDSLESTCKHPAYRSEHELRLQVHMSAMSGAHLAERRGSFISYIELTGAPSWGKVVNETQPLKIREIIVWPGAPEQALHGVNAVLNHRKWRGSGAVPSPVVRRSSVPFV